jgi:hypothetical protein
VAAPRKFSDSQREAIFRLHEAGMTSRKIAEACAEGRSGLARFEISDRTVRDVIGKMEREAQRKLPATVLDLKHGEAMERYPARAAKILDAELNRLEKKQRKSGLTGREVDCIPKLVASSARVERALKWRGGRSRGSRGAGSGARGEPTRAKSALEELAERQRKKAEEAKLTSARTHRDGEDRSAEQPADAPAPAKPAPLENGGGADPRPRAPSPQPAAVHTDPGTSPASTPTLAQREEARRKARAALDQLGAEPSSN